MIHLRLHVPDPGIDAVLAHLRGHPGVAHVMALAGPESTPPATLVLCDVAGESANEVVEWLQVRGVHRHGSITIERGGTIISDHAAAAEARVPGSGANALIWEDLEARVREEGAFTWSYLVFLVVACVIAGIGIMLDSPILVVGAMVVGPDYGPVAALCVAAARRRWSPALAALGTLLGGLGIAAAATLVATLALRATGAAPETLPLTERELTAFIARPDAMAGVVAVLAGIVGMLALTQARAGALVGVLVSVTTVPAAANVGLALASSDGSEAAGAALQLGVNLVGLFVAGVATLVLQARVTRSTPDLRGAA